MRPTRRSQQPARGAPPRAQTPGAGTPPTPAPESGRGRSRRGASGSEKGAPRRAEGVRLGREERGIPGRGGAAARGAGPAGMPGKGTRESRGRKPGILAPGEWGRGGARPGGAAESGHLGAPGGGETAQRSGSGRWPGGSRGDERIKGTRAEVVATGTGGRGKDLRGVTKPRARCGIRRKRARRGSLGSEPPR